MITSADVPLSLLPTYTNTAPIITLPPESYTGVPSQETAGVDGWFDDSDTEGGITTVSGCSYPDEYSASFSVIPTAPCTGPTAAAPVITPPPA
jgi:glucan 1,3-beta-glucosidase